MTKKCQKIKTFCFFVVENFFFVVAYRAWDSRRGLRPIYIIRLDFWLWYVYGCMCVEKATSEWNNAILRCFFVVAVSESTWFVRMQFSKFPSLFGNLGHQALTPPRFLHTSPFLFVLFAKKSAHCVLFIIPRILLVNNIVFLVSVFVFASRHLVKLSLFEKALFWQKGRYWIKKK